MTQKQLTNLIVIINITSFISFIVYVNFFIYYIYNDLDLTPVLNFGLGWVILIPLTLIWGNYAKNKQKEFDN